MFISRIVKANKKIENKVKTCYFKIENWVVGLYFKIENSFVEAFLTREGEKTEEAKERLKRDKHSKKY